MKPIPRSLKDNITSALLHSQKSYGQIAFDLSCSKATVSRLAKKVNPIKENFEVGRQRSSLQ